MSYSIVTLEDCASNYGVFSVLGARPNIYTVTMYGSEGPAHCECKGFKFRGDCKHLGEVWEKACMYNPQWHEGQSEPELRPLGFTYTEFSGNPCPACGGPMVYVKRAV